MLAEELFILGKVLIAAFLGGIIGLERELLKKPAGLRTHILVGTATALIVSLSYVLLDSFSGNEQVHGDPFKLFEAIVVGISFLGAGVIIQKGSEPKNLTTAASILVVAAIGIAVALEVYYVAAGVTVFTLLVNLGLGKAEEALPTKVNKRRD